MDVQRGGTFRTLMRGPDGTEYPGLGCFLEIVPLERIVFTDALEAGFRLATQPFFTEVITMENHRNGTKYTARAMHKDDTDREKGQKIGFHDGWGTVVGQLVAFAAALREGQ